MTGLPAQECHRLRAACKVVTSLGAFLLPVLESASANAGHDLA